MKNEAPEPNKPPFQAFLPEDPMFMHIRRRPKRDRSHIRLNSCESGADTQDVDPSKNSSSESTGSRTAPLLEKIRLAEKYICHGSRESLAKSVSLLNGAISQICSYPEPQTADEIVFLAHALFSRGIAREAQGGREDLDNAVKDSSKAIRLIRKLPWEQIDAFRNDLSYCYNIRGSARKSLGGRANLAEAVKDHSEAIKLGCKLRLEQNDTFRNTLACAYMRRGSAREALGGRDELAEALKDHSEAIILLRKLPWEQNDEFRHTLATACMSRGNARKARGGCDELAEALKDYSEAIQLLRELPWRKNEQFRNGLAGAYTSRGAARQNLGGRTGLDEAVKDHSEAIQLRRELPWKQNDKFRKDLAQAHFNRGLAFKMLGKMGTEKCSDFAKATSLLAPIARSYWPSIGVSFSVRWELVQAALELPPEKWTALPGCFAPVEDLSDLCEEALEDLRYWRGQRVRQFRHFTAPFLHAGALVYARCYSAAQLVDFLLDNCDPERQADADPFLPQVYEAATSILRQVLQATMHNPDKCQETQLLVTCRQRIQSLRERYLGGSWEAVRLQIEELRADADHQEARALHVEFMETHPGHLEAAAAWFRDQFESDPDQALTDAISRFAGALRLNLPADPTEEATAEELNTAAVSLAGALTEGFTTQPTADPNQPAHSPTLAIISQRFDQASNALVAFEKALAREGLPGCEAAVARHREGELAAARSHALENRELRIRQVHQQIQALTVRSLRAVLPEIGSLFNATLETLQRELEERTDLEGPELEAWLEERGHELSEKLSAAFSSVARSELRASEAALTATFACELDSLNEEERHYLALAHHFASHPDFAKMAGLPAGIALETALRRRLFDTLQGSRPDLRDTPSGKATELEERFRAFLASPVGSHLAEGSPFMLGQLIRLLQASVFWKTDTDRLPLPETTLPPVFRAVAHDPEAMTATPEARSRHRKQLWEVGAIRNRCAHPAGSPITEADVTTALNHLLGPAGFFRPFAGVGGKSDA